MYRIVIPVFIALTGLGCAKSEYDPIRIWRVEPIGLGGNYLSDENLSGVVSEIEQSARIPQNRDPYIKSELTTDKSDYKRFYTQVKIDGRVFVIGHFAKLGSLNLKVISPPVEYSLEDLSNDQAGFFLVPADSMPLLHSHGGCWALKVVYDVGNEKLLQPPFNYSNHSADAKCMGVGS